MQRDEQEIFRMAREDGGHEGDECEQCGEKHYLWLFGNEELEIFAFIVAEAAADAEAKRIHAEGMVTVGHMRERIAAEREAILDLVDSYAKNNTELAAAIRARGQ